MLGERGGGGDHGGALDVKTGRSAFTDGHQAITWPVRSRIRAHCSPWGARGGHGDRGERGERGGAQRGGVVLEILKAAGPLCNGVGGAEAVGEENDIFFRGCPFYYILYILPFFTVKHILYK